MSLLITYLEYNPTTLETMSDRDQQPIKNKMSIEITKQEIEVKQAFFKAGAKVKTFSGRIKTLRDGELLQNKNLGTVYALTDDGFDTTIMNKKGVWLRPLSECYKNIAVLCDCPGQCRNSC